MDKCILILLVVIIVLLVIIIFGIIGCCWCFIPKFREPFVNKIQDNKIQDNKIQDNNIFKSENRISYYMGNVKKTLFIKLYEKKFNKNYYIINSTFLEDDEKASSDRPDVWNNYMDEIKKYYLHFKQNHPDKHDKQFIFVPGDIGSSREDVAFLCKTRPINNKGKNVLLPLNNKRHWGPVKDVKLYDIPYENKKNFIFWRGAATGKDKRVDLVEKYYNYPRPEINVGFTRFTENYKGSKNPRFLKNSASMSEMLQYKFLVSVEGNDVGSNLKWIMSSNSLCLMPNPTVESWFMEGLLRPWVHYVPLKSDFSDLVQKWKWCIENPEICKKIIRNANIYVNNFMDGQTEFSIIDGVLNEYSNKISIF